MSNRKILILGLVGDLIADFLYYNRKEDEILRVGEIEEAIKLDETTIDEIVNKFREGLSEK